MKKKSSSKKKLLGIVSKTSKSLVIEKLKIPREQINIKNTSIGLSFFFVDNWTVIITVIFMVRIIMMGVYCTLGSEKNDYKQVLEEVLKAKKNLSFFEMR